MDHQAFEKTKRYLPHWITSGATYWVTFRLGDSLPQQKLRKWRSQRDEWLELHPKPWSKEEKHNYHEIFTERIEYWLDCGYGSSCLARPDCRNIVKECILRFHLQRHQLHYAVIMPNHVHLLIKPFNGVSLSALLGGMKSASSRGCNQILHRAGPLWMQESYDRIVRDEKEYRTFWKYIEQNPLKAGLRQDQYWLMEKQ